MVDTFLVSAIEKYGLIITFISHSLCNRGKSFGKKRKYLARPQYEAVKILLPGHCLNKLTD